ncbi:hypothetical protein L6452_32061 [Arctium lappa]|uniref:Uncharacterized protein n=1 Tax=Arctium lappa TaxID=4217 RepID=A0ACB8Z3T0_ARCLA|nr:hypothetical protein L6452_32061 [Arctium lappa]
MRDGMQYLSDEDVVHICLVVMVEVMFMGRELNQLVSDTVLRAVDDLMTFDSYPWGSHIWTHTYNSLHLATARRHTQKNKHISKSTLSGFAHALKVWILEMFPVCRHHFTKRTDRAIRGTRWDRDIVLNKKSCVAIFNSVSDVRSLTIVIGIYPASPIWKERRPGDRRRDLDDDEDDEDDDDEDDDDYEDGDDGTGYQAPPSSSHHGVPPPDPYQHRRRS